MKKEKSKKLSLEKLKLSRDELIKERSEKSVRYHFDNIERLKKGEPSKEELKKMYGYLGTCWACEKPLRFLEPFYHSFTGNAHKFGCNIFGRIFGWIYNFVLTFFIKLPLIIIVLPFYIIYLGIKEFIKEVKK